MTRDSTLFAKNDVFYRTSYQPASSERHNMIPHSETLHAWAEPRHAMVADQNDSRRRVCPMKRRKSLPC
jgi:hypothetical protein